MIEAMIRLTTPELITALGLPGDALVNRRVPKKMLAENAAHTLADRKLVQEHVKEVTWIAALKPTNAGVPAYEDDLRAYLELAILSVKLRGLNPLDCKSAKVPYISELLHRAIPYPLVLVLDDGNNFFLSMAHIRWAQKEANKTVLDGEMAFAIFRPLSPARSENADKSCLVNSDFLCSLAMHKQSRTHLHALYQGWMDTVTAWEAASVSGRFVMSTSPEHAAQRRQALRRCRELDEKIASSRNKARKEKQKARQVTANLEIKELLAERQLIIAYI